jgi:hypothetical protein
MVLGTPLRDPRHTVGMSVSIVREILAINLRKYVCVGINSTWTSHNAIKLSVVL